MPPALTFARALPATYWFLWLGILINRLGNFVVPFLALYLTQERHIEVGRVGLIIAMYGAGSIVAGPLGGALSDRFGRRPAILGGMTLGALAMLGLGFAHEPATLMFATFTLGLFGDLARPAMSATIADVVPPPLRARAFALQYWAVNLGFSVAPAIAGAVATHGFYPLFIGDAVTTLACALVIWRAVPESRPEPSEEATFAQLDVPYRDPSFVPLALCTAMISIVFLQASVSLPLHARGHGIDSGQYGLLMALNGLLIVIVQPFTLRFVDRFDKAHLLAIGTLLTGAGFGLTAFAHTMAQYAGTVVLWTLGEIALVPAGSAVVAELAPIHLRGSYQGAYQLSWSAGTFFAPLLAGWVLQHSNGDALWTGCGWVGVVISLTHLLIAKPRARRLSHV